MVRITRAGKGHNVSYTTLIIAALLFVVALTMFIFTGDKSSIEISGTATPTWLAVVAVSFMLVIYDLMK